MLPSVTKFELLDLLPGILFLEDCPYEICIDNPESANSIDRIIHGLILDSSGHNDLSDCNRAILPKLQRLLRGDSELNEESAWRWSQAGGRLPITCGRETASITTPCKRSSVGFVRHVFADLGQETPRGGNPLCKCKGELSFRTFSVF